MRVITEVEHLRFGSREIHVDHPRGIGIYVDEHGLFDDWEWSDADDWMSEHHWYLVEDEDDFAVIGHKHGITAFLMLAADQAYDSNIDEQVLRKCLPTIAPQADVQLDQDLFRSHTQILTSSGG